MTAEGGTGFEPNPKKVKDITISSFQIGCVL
jgi:hypothetical protein